MVGHILNVLLSKLTYFEDACNHLAVHYCIGFSNTAPWCQKSGKEMMLGVVYLLWSGCSLFLWYCDELNKFPWLKSFYPDACGLLGAFWSYIQCFPLSTLFRVFFIIVSIPSSHSGMNFSFVFCRFWWTTQPRSAEYHRCILLRNSPSFFIQFW